MAQQQMIRPGQIDTLPFLDEPTKQHFKNGLANLWQLYDGAPEGSPAKNDARLRIGAASAKLMQRMSSGNRPGSSSNAQQQRPPQMNGQMQQQPQMVQHNNSGQAQQPAQQPVQQQPSAQAPQNLQAELAHLQAKVLAQMNAFQVFPEPGTTSKPEFEQYKGKFKNSLGQVLLRKERAQAEMARVQAMMKEAAQNGQEVQDEVKTKGQNAQNQYREASAAIQQLELKNTQNKQAYAQKQQQQQQAGQPQQNPNPAQRPGTQIGQQSDIKVEQRMSASPPQAQKQFAQQQSSQTQQQKQQMPPQLPQQQATQQPMHQTPQPATQPQMPQQNFPQQQMQQQQQPQQQHPQRPQINAQQAQQHAQYGQQQFQTPQSAAPQQSHQQAPRPLTQTDALNRANSFNQQQQQSANINQQQPGQQQQQMQTPHGNMSAGGMQFPQSVTQHTPTGGFPSNTNQQFNSATTKFPIPKSLNLGPNTQQPVAGPSSRPTMMNQAGMLHAPGIQKPPPFTLEGEGDHVLSKRKLDELVRQVTGSTNPVDGLSPDVEESVLTLADNFVDDLIKGACRLAKLRQGGGLEVRDVQMMLERNYGMRIPGYSLDEVRTVRKFQPAAGWVNKVQAVQAAKVMGGNKDT